VCFRKRLAEFEEEFNANPLLLHISHLIKSVRSQNSPYKGKGLPQQAVVAQGVPGRLRRRIFLTFGTTKVVGRQPYVPAAFTPGEILGAHI